MGGKGSGRKPKKRAAQARPPTALAFRAQKAPPPSPPETPEAPKAKVTRGGPPPIEPLSVEKKAEILSLHRQGFSHRQIGEAVGRKTRTVEMFLRRHRSTVREARSFFEAKAEHLARRVVKHANVDQSIDVLGRIGVIPKEAEGQSGARLQVVIGMPGHPVPVPTDAQLSGTEAPAIPSPEKPAIDVEAREVPSLRDWAEETRLAEARKRILAEGPARGPSPGPGLEDRHEALEDPEEGARDEEARALEPV